MPKRNERFGCGIQNLTECIKDKQTADAKGAAGAKSDDFLFSNQLYHIFPLQPATQVKLQIAPLFGHRLPLFVMLETRIQLIKSITAHATLVVGIF